MLQARITKEMLSAMQGAVPTSLATCAENGMPNVTYISQVFYVDEQHVALSHQFMSKTWRNLQENPQATVVITCPSSFRIWKLRLRYVEEQREGPVFDQMDMQLEAIASLFNMEGIFKIQAALICKVEHIECLYDGLS